MIKLFAGLMIILGCIGIGWRFREDMAERIRLLKELNRMLLSFKREIQYGRDSLPETCRLVAERMAPPVKNILSEICEKMQEEDGADFETVFTAAFVKGLKNTALSERDRTLLIDMAVKLRSTDVEQQMQQISLCQSELAKELEKAEGAFMQKGRTAMGLGVFGGFVLVLILF